MGRQVTKTPKTGRPRVHPIKRGAGIRPQLAFSITVDLMLKIREAIARNGRTQSGEVEARLERSFYADDLMTQQYGADAPLLTTIVDAVHAARHLGEALAAREGLNQDDADVRIYSAILATLRLLLTWHDPAVRQNIANPMHVGGGALTWETLPNHAAWTASNRASMDSKRLRAFKAIAEKFQRKSR